MSDPWIVEGKPPRQKPVTVFGHFLKMRRAALGIRQRDLSEMFGETDSFQGVEMGRNTMPADKLKPLADVLQVDLSLLEKVYAIDLFMRNRQAEKSRMR